MNLVRSAVSLAALLVGAHASAALVYDQNVTNNVINGSGVTNGGFTVERNAQTGLELGLRAKVRYDVADNQPKNIWNSNGDGTYNHAAGFNPAQAERARWNFEWSVNSNYNGAGGNLLGTTGTSYTLGMDYDASANESYTTINLLGLPFDHAFGTNATAESGGTVATPATFAALAAANNLVQNSWNLAFFDDGLFFPGDFNPSADGEYMFFLEARDAAGALLGRTEITVIVGDGALQVPEPASLGLVGLALAGAAAAARRRRRS